MRIYLDHNATTPVHPEVASAMQEMLRENWGNPSSTTAEGAQARRAVDRAREQVAALVGADADEIVFTGSATEANNTALHSVARASDRTRFLSSTIEHPSVDEPLAFLGEQGSQVIQIGVDETGRLDLTSLRLQVDDRTALVAVILANNEIGVVQDIPTLAEIVHRIGAHLHVDATQALGKIPVDVATLGADTLVGSAHKFNGPKGAGFLWARKGVLLTPWIRGGPQEKRRRGGTENTSGIVGLGQAAELARVDLPVRATDSARLRDRLWEGILEGVPGVRRNGSEEHVLPNTLNVEFEGAAGELLLQVLDGEGIAVSAGAACASGSIEPSHVLSAIGRNPEQARGSLRFSTGLRNDEAQIDRVLGLLPGLVARAREVAA
ncbi:MAG: cysteine desulfurase [bacterium]|nr:cysteine desulfurase [bacterium]MCP5067555.1 cysteine desulfurase [bacterium]